jgi:hypothetical protein
MGGFVFSKFKKIGHRLHKHTVCAGCRITKDLRANARTKFSRYIRSATLARVLQVPGALGLLRGLR